MVQNSGSSTPHEAFEGLREMRDAYLDAMSKAMIDVVNSDAYTKATGSMMEGYLSWATPFRESLDTIMRQSLEQMSLPSRQEVAVLAERFTNVEMRLDDVDAKLDEIARSISELSVAGEVASTGEKKSTPPRKKAPAPKRVTSRKSATSRKAPAGKG